MWRHVLLFGILIASPAIGRCETVHFTVDSAKIGVVYKGGYVDLVSSGLRGTVLRGQRLSLDLVFTSDLLARLQLANVKTFGVGFDVRTNAATHPGNAGPTTGFLLDPEGNQLGASKAAGRSDSDDGTFGMGLVLFTPGDLGGKGQNVVDISGVHFDTTFPATGFVVTDVQLRFTLNAPGNRLKFGPRNRMLNKKMSPGFRRGR